MATGHFELRIWDARRCLCLFMALTTRTLSREGIVLEEVGIQQLSCYSHASLVRCNGKIQYLASFSPSAFGQASLDQGVLCKVPTCYILEVGQVSGQNVPSVKRIAQKRMKNYPENGQYLHSLRHIDCCITMHNEKTLNPVQT